MIKIGICDDDVHMLSYLSDLCSDILPESMIENYKNGCDLLKSKIDYDIILMDVKMDDIDGVEVVKQLRKQTSAETFNRPVVIFVTAYDNYVFQALDLFAFHYLLKPLNKKKFEDILNLAVEECLKEEKEAALFFHTKTSHLRLYPRQINYIESNLRKVVIHTKKEQFEIYSTMSYIENLLGRGFYRCHRGYLVNMNKIKGYNRQSITLTDGTVLLLSKPKYPDFVETYMHFMKRRAPDVFTSTGSGVKKSGSVELNRTVI